MRKSEEALQAVPGLPLTIVRPATVYGPGDVAGLMTRCVVAAAYWRMDKVRPHHLTFHCMTTQLLPFRRPWTSCGTRRCS